MTAFETLQYYFTFPFVRYALVVGVLIALCASLFGVTLVLKRFSFIGDGLSHVAFGALAVLSACLVPFLRLGCQYLLYQGAGLVAGAAGPKNLTALLRKLGDAFGLVLAMTGTSALLLIITLVSSLTAVTP